MNLLLLGIGQSLRGDDAAGLEAVRRWQKDFPCSSPLAHVELCEQPGLDLLDLINGFQAIIIVDALQTEAAPGTLFCLDLDDLASFETGAGSAHGWGIVETLAMGCSLYPALAECPIRLIGIAGEQFNVGTGLSLNVQICLPEAAKLIEKEIQGLTG